MKKGWSNILEIVSKNNNLYNILDSEDGVVELCSFLDIISAMQLGVDIKGVFLQELYVFQSILSFNSNIV